MRYAMPRRNCSISHPRVGDLLLNHLLLNHLLSAIDESRSKADHPDQTAASAGNARGPAGFPILLAPSVATFISSKESCRHFA